MKQHLMLALALAATPFAAAAGDVSFTYIEAGYVRSTLNDYNGSGNGGAIAGSVEFGQSNVYAFGSYSRTRTSVDYYIGSIDYDLNTYDLGLGYALPLGERANVLFEAAYLRADAGDLDQSVDGYRVSVGARGAFSKRVEGSVRVNYADSRNSDAEGSFSLKPGVLIKFNPTWGLSAEADFGQDGQTYFAGIRASF